MRDWPLMRHLWWETYLWWETTVMRDLPLMRDHCDETYLWWYHCDERLTSDERPLWWETYLSWETTLTEARPYISIHLYLQWKTTCHIRLLFIGIWDGPTSQVSLLQQVSICITASFDVNEFSSWSIIVNILYKMLCMIPVMFMKWVWYGGNGVILIPVMFMKWVLYGGNGVMFESCNIWGNGVMFDPCDIHKVSLVWGQWCYVWSLWYS